MVFFAAALLGLAFGAGDQYLGSLVVSGMWTASVSLLSAPWLALPFVFGCTQRTPSRAALVGLVVTLAALLGYFLMIMGSFEGGRSTFNVHEVHGLLVSNRRNIAGGLLTGPLFGLLGHLWRKQRSWVSAICLAGALCLEPVAETIIGNRNSGDSVVWPVEIAVGLAVAFYFLATGLAYRRQLRSDLPET